MKKAWLRWMAILAISAGPAGAAQKTIRAVLQPSGERKMAPEFRLPAASGKRVALSAYRGKVVLLDFWATECGGCKAEIPAFIELARTYKGRGLTVVGVSLDVIYEDLKSADEAWRRVKPFVTEHRVIYPILMGDDAVSKLYRIEEMPATYLIDKKGRVAATYIGVVEKSDVEMNLNTLLQE